MTSALTFGGAGVAQASTYDVSVPTTTTTLAQPEAEDNGDKTGLWGLLGLLGLVGLAGLKRRNDTTVTGVAGTTGHGNAPRT